MNKLETVKGLGLSGLGTYLVLIGWDMLCSLDDRSDVWRAILVGQVLAHGVAGVVFGAYVLTKQPKPY